MKTIRMGRGLRGTKGVRGVNGQWVVVQQEADADSKQKNGELG
jgi:hypothetical protein